MRDNFDWILFDADHTLFDFDLSSRISLKATLDHYGIAHSDEALDQYFKINRACWRAFEEGKIDRDTLTRRRFKLFFDNINVSHLDLLEFNDAYLSLLPSHPYFLEGAMELLIAVRKYFKLGIITNGLKQVQRPRLVKSGIEDFFEVIVVSGEIGLAKPDPAYFAHAHQKMNLPNKERVLVIGDNLYSDIHGGKNYGFRTCWYNPSGLPLSENVQPDHEVSSHVELLELLIGKEE